MAWRSSRGRPRRTPAAPVSHVGVFVPGIQSDLHVTTVPFGGRTGVTATSDLATIVALQPTPEGFRPRAQFVDVPTLGLGAAAVGPTFNADEEPTVWAVSRASGRYALAWSGEDGVRLERFCFSGAP